MINIKRCFQFASLGLVIILLLFSWPFFGRKKLATNIAHAGGVIGDHIYTNSFDAFAENYNKGFKIFEFDISIYDGEYVCLHTIKDVEKIISRKLKDDKLKTLITEMESASFTMLLLEDAIKLIKKHKNIKMIFDVKAANRLAIYDELNRLLQKYNIDQRQVIVQVFNKDEVLYAQKYFSNLLYVIWQIENANFIDFIKYLKKSDIKFVSIDRRSKRTIALLNFYRILFYRELSIIPYTVNNKKEAIFFAMLGIRSVFTDRLSP
jgi:glycerophosphoryl diester phosphodiesterase